MREDYNIFYERRWFYDADRHGEFGRFASRVHANVGARQKWKKGKIYSLAKFRSVYSDFILRVEPPFPEPELEKVVVSSFSVHVKNRTRSWNQVIFRSKGIDWTAFDGLMVRVERTMGARKPWGKPTEWRIEKFSTTEGHKIIWK